MKFVKTVDGDYINVAHVRKFYIEGRFVHADNDDDIIADSLDFKTDGEAQEWLDELIDELERDDD